MKRPILLVICSMLSFVLAVPLVSGIWDETQKTYQGYDFALDSEWMKPNSEIWSEWDFSGTTYSWEALDPWNYADDSGFIYTQDTNGWFDYKCGLTSIVNESSASGYYNLTLITIYWRQSQHSLYSGYWFGFSINGTDMMSDFYYAWEAGFGYTVSYDKWETNPDTGYPWTRDDLNDTSVRILGKLSVAITYPLKVTRVIAIAQPVAAPEPVASDFVLRPDGDIESDWGLSISNWTEYPNDNIKFDKINDTEYNGDGYSTYIYSNESDDVRNAFTVTDLPSNVEKTTYYNVTIWAIANTDLTDFQAIPDEISIGIWNPYSQSAPYNYKFDVSPAWGNYSATFEYNPVTGIGWTWIDINNMQIWIKGHSEEITNINVTQVGIIINKTNITFTQPLDEVFETNFFGLIWLLILFLPAMALSIYAPTLGFVIGMTITLVVFGLTQAGFFPFTFIGLLAISVVLYKGA